MNFTDSQSSDSGTFKYGESEENCFEAFTFEPNEDEFLTFCDRKSSVSSKTALDLPKNIRNDPESFLNYLNNHFKSEINLEDQEEFPLNFVEPEKQFEDFGMSIVKNCVETHLGDLKIKSSNDQSESISASIGTTNEASPNNSTVKLNYRGQKNNFAKGINSERIDVILKTFVRALKRFLCEKFATENNIPLDYGKMLH